MVKRSSFLWNASIYIHAVSSEFRLRKKLFCVFKPFSSDNSIGNEVIIPIEVQTLLSTARTSPPISNNSSDHDDVSIIELSEVVPKPQLQLQQQQQQLQQQQHHQQQSSILPPSSTNGHIESNLAMQQPSLITVDSAKDATNDEKDIMLEWHRNKPSIWQQYYGSKRLKYSNMVKKIKGKFDVNPAMSYVSVEYFNVTKKNKLLMLLLMLFLFRFE